ncbi:hypothetical protein BJ165DRAFT_1611245 [Panaeolus papilionaceus]|nr:hypothetical protein BJ165DRAFT_1611245 [Panaeolus papilionaceus]
MSLYASIISSINELDAVRLAGVKRAREHDLADDSQTFDDDIAHEENVVRGYKASLHNPHVSARAKMESEDILKQKGAIQETKTKDPKFKKYYAKMHNKNLPPEERYKAEQYLEQSGCLEFVEDEATHQYNINRGYQATANSESSSGFTLRCFPTPPNPTDPNVSEEARRHARAYLKEHGGV